MTKVAASLPNPRPPAKFEFDMCVAVASATSASTSCPLASSSLRWRLPIVQQLVWQPCSLLNNGMRSPRFCPVASDSSVRRFHRHSCQTELSLRPPLLPGLAQNYRVAFRPGRPNGWLFSHRHYSGPLRGIEYHDPKTGLELVFQSNNFTVPTLTSMPLYQTSLADRTVIQMDQCIKAFYGKSPGAMQTSILSAIVVYLIVAI